MPNLFPGALGDSGRYAVPASVTNVIKPKGEAMRKVLIAAAVLAVAACGEKKPAAGDSTNTMAPPPAAMSGDTTHKDSTMAKDTSMKMGGDTTHKDTTAKKP
jgi:predicted small lipoprotein YifL